MKCQECRTENLATRKFCRECGAKMVLVCPQCGTENLPEDKFCGECGQNLTIPKETTAIDFSEPHSYTPKFLADKILTNRSSIEGERKLVTVLFADVADYTAISENLDPEEVHQLMDDCFQFLMEAYEKAQTGSGQVVGIVGDAAVGKSRLLLEFKDRLSRDDIIFLQGHCLHFGSATAYLPILDILRSYFEIKESGQEYLVKKNMEEKIRRLDGNLLGVLPPFHELLSLEVEDEAYLNHEPMQKREKTFEAIRDLVVRESQTRSVIITVEDLHWIDKTSDEFVGYLVEWLANSRILLILHYRPEYTHPWGSKSFYNRIGLDHLTSDSSTQLIQSFLR